MHILSPETDIQRKGENDRRKYFMIKSPRKNVDGGSNPQPPDHQSDAHPTEPPRQAVSCINTILSDYEST